MREICWLGSGASLRNYVNKDLSCAEVGKKMVIKMVRRSICVPSRKHAERRSRKKCGRTMICYYNIMHIYRRRFFSGRNDLIFSQCCEVKVIVSEKL